jgi:hypothetical protein
LFLANSDVDAVEFLGFIRTVVETLLIENGVEGDSGFTGLTITNDQFSLTAAYWDERVDGFQTSLHRLVYGLSGNNTWSFDVNASTFFTRNGSLTIKGITEWIDDTSEKFWAYWYIDNSTGTTNNIAFLNFSIVTEHYDTNIIRFQVQSHTLNTAVEFDHLFSLDVLETMDARNTVTNG